MGSNEYFTWNNIIFEQIYYRYGNCCPKFSFSRHKMGCKSNYDSESEVVSVHSFPTNVDERQTWVDALPNILSKSPQTRDMVVCV